MNCFYQCPFAFNAAYNDMYRTEMQMAADPYTYPGNLPGAIKLIQNAISGEREDELFYDYLISVAPNQEAKNIITGIRNDERKHNAMFRKIYTQLTGKPVPPMSEEPFEKPKSYCDGIKKALMGELNAVVNYRKILFAMQKRVHINMLTEIITDELRHAALYNYLYASGCMMR